MDSLVDYERRFRRAGLPLFIEGYSAASDVFTRALPLLALVFVGELLGAIQLDWSLGENIGAGVGGLAILVGAFALLNRLRGRRAFELPRRVGTVELGAFVILPALLPLIFGGQTRSALGTAAANLALLALLYLVVGYGLIAILRGAAERLVSELSLAVRTITRALPLLLVFALVLFINTEMWQTFADIPTRPLVAIAALLLGLGALFLLAQLPGEVRAMEHETSAHQPLTTRQRINVALIVTVSHVLQVTVVGVAVGLFFVAFGALAISPEIRESWIGDTGDVLFTIDFLGEPAQVTVELLRVSSAIAAFSSLYYAIAVLTDSTYRDQFMDRLTAELRDVFTARAEYLALRSAD